MTATVPTVCPACDRPVSDPRPCPDPTCRQCGGTGIVRAKFVRVVDGEPVDIITLSNPPAPTIDEDD